MGKLKSTFDIVLPLIFTLWSYFENGVLQNKCSHWMHFPTIANINVSFIGTKRHLAKLKRWFWAQALCKACCRFSFLFSSHVTGYCAHLWNCDSILRVPSDPLTQQLYGHSLCLLCWWCLFPYGWHDSLPTRIKGLSTQYAQLHGLPEPPFLKSRLRD